MFDYLIFIIFAIVLLMIIFYLYFRDKGIYQKLSLYESAIDDLSSRIYHLEKSKSVSSVNSNQYSELLKQVEERLDDKLNDLGEPLLRTVRAYKNIQERLNSLEKRVDEKIAELKEVSKPTQSNISSSNYEDRVIALFKEGKSIEEISKLTRVGIGEVELILKLSNLKK